MSFLSGGIAAIVYGLIFVILFAIQAFQNGSLTSLKDGFIYSCIIILGVGLFLGLTNRFGSGVGAGGSFEETEIITNDILRFHWKNILNWKNWAKSLGWGLLGGIVLLFLAITRFKFLSAMHGFLLGLIGGFVCSMYFCLREVIYFVALENPYQRFKKLFFLRWIGWVFTFTLIFLSIGFFDPKGFAFILIFFPAIIVEALFYTPLVKHLVLRLCFYLEGIMPLQNVTFLNYATESRILEKDGGHWRFRHQILQEFIAKLNI